MFLSSMPAVSPTFEYLDSVSLMAAFVALAHGAVLGRHFTIFKFIVMEQALLHQNIGFSWGPYL